MKRTIIGLVCFIGLTSFAMLASRTKAQAPDSNACNLKRSDFEALQAAEDKNFGSTEEIRSELQIRKKLLGQVLDCVVAEANGERNALSAVASDDADVINLKNNLLGQIDSISNYYQTQKSRINDVGLWDSKNLAQSVAAFRNGNYKPLHNTVNDFLLWAGNQKIISAAQTRFGQINQALILFGLINQSAVSTPLGEAQDNLNQALNYNEAARLAILSGNDNPLPSIKSSLASLTLMYQNFFEISSIVNSTSSANR